MKQENPKEASVLCNGVACVVVVILVIFLIQSCPSLFKHPPKDDTPCEFVPRQTSSGEFYYEVRPIVVPNWSEKK